MVGPRRQGMAMAVPAPLLRSPEREALALAIAAADKTRADLDACRSAIQAAEIMESNAEAVVEAARADVEQAKADRAAEITAAAAAGLSMPGSDRQRNARLREVEALDELEAIRSSVGAVRAPLADREYDAVEAAKAVQRAASDVIASQLPSAVEVALAAIKNAEICVRGAYAIYKAATGNGTSHRPDLMAQINAVTELSSGTWDYADPSRGDAHGWHLAAAQLLTDPNAPLPNLREVADLSPGEPGPGRTGPRRLDW